MFERFTDRARKVVVMAQEEARLLDHGYIGTEHLLLGLTRDDDSVALRALQALDARPDLIRREIVAAVGRGDGTPPGHIPFTPRAKKTLELSLREALAIGHNYIGTEHILLGIVREGDGIAAQVLQRMGLDLARVRDTILQLLSGSPEGVVAVGSGTGVDPVAERAVAPASASAPRDSPTCPACRASLTAWLRVAVIDAPGEGDATTPVRLAFCARCGAALQALS